MDLINLLGTATLILLVFLLIGAVITFILVGISIRSNKRYLPQFLLVLLSAFESPAKAVFKFFKMDDAVVDRVAIDLQNKFNKANFAAIAYNERALFLPQCLRSTECPAKLSTEGIKCIGCGKCVVKDIKKDAEKLGYRVFVVPGSSFIKRMIIKYGPKAVIGVGCQPEIKQAIDICQRFNLPGQGIVLQRAGCMNTIVDVDDVYLTLALEKK